MLFDRLNSSGNENEIGSSKEGQMKSLVEVGPRSVAEMQQLIRNPEAYQERLDALRSYLEDLHAIVLGHTVKVRTSDGKIQTADGEPVLKFEDFDNVVTQAKHLKEHQMDCTLFMKYKEENAPFTIPVDEEAKYYYEKYNMDENFYPGISTGNGSCLPNSISLAFTGNF